MVIKNEKPLNESRVKGLQAETEGFEPSYRDEPINAFRVRRVTAASLRLRMNETDILSANGSLATRTLLLYTINRVLCSAFLKFLKIFP